MENPTNTITLFLRLNFLLSLLLTFTTTNNSFVKPMTQCSVQKKHRSNHDYKEGDYSDVFFWWRSERKFLTLFSIPDNQNMSCYIEISYFNTRNETYYPHDKIILSNKLEANKSPQHLSKNEKWETLFSEYLTHPKSVAYMLRNTSGKHQFINKVIPFIFQQLVNT